MAGQRKKTKKQVTLFLEENLLRAIELQAARQKSDRVAWITEAIKDRLEREGKLP